MLRYVDHRIDTETLFWKSALVHGALWQWASGLTYLEVISHPLIVLVFHAVNYRATGQSQQAAGGCVDMLCDPSRLQRYRESEAGVLGNPSRRNVQVAFVLQGFRASWLKLIKVSVKLMGEIHIIILRDDQKPKLES